MTDTHRTLVIRVPVPPQDVQPTIDQFGPVRDIRFGSDDKAYILGFIASVGLSDHEEAHFLTEYATRYRRALIRSQGNHGTANRAANAWVRAGCRGYLQIER